MCVCVCAFFIDYDNNLKPCISYYKEPDVILVEFEKEVKAEEWFQRGSQLFQEEDYKLASSCFNAGNSFGWAAWARGRQMSASGRKREAKDSFRTAVRAFFEASNFENCLDVMSEDISNIPPWEEEDNEIFDRALQERPHYFDRRKTVQLSLVRGVWNALSVDDLMNDSTSALFKEFRSHPKLQEMVDKFHSEIQASLIDQHGSSSIKIVEWYHSHNDRSRATNYAARILRVIDNDELLHSVLKLMKLRPDTLLEEISRRSLFVEASTICLNENSWDLDLAERISDRALETAVEAEHNVDKLLQAWGLVQNDGRVKSLFNLRKKRPSKISLLCLLFQVRLRYLFWKSTFHVFIF